MDRLEMFEIAKLIAATFGALGVAWYWNRVKDRFDKYQYLDESYSGILRVYFENPRFDQPELTAKYAEAFIDYEHSKYHYFAMRVHTFLESVFDMSKGKIRTDWMYIYRHHANLHATWLQDHQALHEPGYLNHALGHIQRN
jgi:hypothetical protein